MKTLFEAGNYQELSERFALCNPITDESGYHHLLLWMRNAFTTMAIVDYPYQASFLGNLPAYPVRAACEVGDKNSCLF